MITLEDFDIDVIENGNNLLDPKIFNIWTIITWIFKLFSVEKIIGDFICQVHAQ